MRSRGFSDRGAEFSRLAIFESFFATVAGILAALVAPGDAGAVETFSRGGSNDTAIGGASARGPMANLCARVR
jgi:hypothetical protein